MQTSTVHFLHLNHTSALSQEYNILCKVSTINSLNTLIENYLIFGFETTLDAISGCQKTFK